MNKITTKRSILGIFLLSLVFFNTNAQDKHIVEKLDGTKVVVTTLNSYDKTVAQVSNGVGTVYDDLKSAAPKVGDAIKSLSKELKIASNKVWDVLVKQQLVWSVAFLLLTLTSITNWFIFYKRNFPSIKSLIKGKKENWVTIDNPDFEQDWFDKYNQNDRYSDHSKERNDIRYKKRISVLQGTIDVLIPQPDLSKQYGMGGFKYLHLVICILLSLLSFYHFNDMLTGFMNPEFGAMKTIAEIASQIK